CGQVVAGRSKAAQNIAGVDSSIRPRGYTSFGSAERFIVVPPQRSTSRCHEFGAAAFDEIAGLRNDALQDFENLAHASFTVDEFRKRLDEGGVVLDRSGRTHRSGSGIHFWCSGCHMRMLLLFDAESKGGWLARDEVSAGWADCNRLFRTAI